MKNRNNEKKSVGLTKSFYALFTLFAFVCTLLFNGLFYDASSASSYSNCSTHQITKPNKLALEQCYFCSNQDVPNPAKSAATSLICDLTGLDFEKIFVSIPKIKFLECARSYQYLRLNVLSAQNHPPT